MTVVNRLMGLLVGVVLLAGGLLLATETLLAFLQRPPWVVPYDQLAGVVSSLTWRDRTLTATAALIVLVGGALVILQLWPERPSRLPLVEERANRLAALDARGLQDLLRRSAVDDEDVLDAAVRVSRRTARVSGRAPRDARSRAVESRTRERVQALVDGLGLQRPLKVKVQIKHSKARVR